MKLLLLLICAVLSFHVGCSGSGQDDGPSSDILIPPKDPTVVANSGPEITNLYPPSVDPDQDNVPDAVFHGYAGPLDNCPDFFNPDQKDTDGDDVGDACEAP